MSSWQKITDIIIYGGTASGVVAGIQSARMNKSVILIEPSSRIGGLSSGGLGYTDIGNKAAIGGIAREFYQRIKKHYDDSFNWKWQKPEEYESNRQRQVQSSEDTMWTFEPSAALKVFKEMVDEYKITIVYGERLNRISGVEMDGSCITSITMESGKTFRGKMFIDTTYEGDLMASAGVSFHLGREATSVYGETLNGAQFLQARFHQLKKGINPYTVKGDSASGLLPGINTKNPAKEGTGDHCVQAYCFRMCLTDHPDNRSPFYKPHGYNELDYELLFRNFEAGETKVPWINSKIPNRKTDTNNSLGFSTDFIGQNYNYPEANYKEREKIIRQHLEYQQGLMWTLSNHPRIPEHVRKEVSCWGMCQDEFTEGNGWQSQLYIREARRMISDYIMTQHNCQGHIVAEDSVGLATFNMDSHHVQRYVNKEGYVQNEGDVEIGGFLPYSISFKSIVPRESECVNLIVPMCLSASHIAFGSIRMEPVFMVLGQSAATVASQAIDEKVAVQRIEYAKLRDKMLVDRQKLI